MKNEIEFNGTWFYKNTPKEVMNVICNNLHSRRVRVWYGDQKTGKSWNEENDVCGYFGRTTGKHFPILVNNKQSSGGGIVLTDCIIKIVDTKTKQVLYKHPLFNQSVFTYKKGSDLPEYDAIVLQDGEIYARCNSLQGAIRLSQFMNGGRMSK